MTMKYVVVDDDKVHDERVRVYNARLLPRRLLKVYLDAIFEIGVSHDWVPFMCSVIHDPRYPFPFYLFLFLPPYWSIPFYLSIGC